MTRSNRLPGPRPGLWMNRIQRLVVSLGMALFLWLSIITQQDPMRIRLIDNLAVPCPELSAESPLICDSIEDTLQVTLRAPQSVWDSLQVPFQQYLSVDLHPRDHTAELASGVVAFECMVSSAAPGLQILTQHSSTTPDTDACAVNVPLRNRVSLAEEAEALLTQQRVLPISLEKVGEIPDGFLLESLMLDMQYVEASGPPDALNQIDRALAYIPFYSSDFDAQQGSLKLLTPVVVVDQNGNALPAITVAPALVTASVNYSSLPNTRRVRVVPDPPVPVPSGYRLVQVQSLPEHVLLEGTSEALDLVPDPLPVRIGEALEPPARSTTITVPLEVPAGVTANVEEITFAVEVSHVVLDNTQRGTARCQTEHPDLIYDFAVVFLHLRGPFEAFNLLYAMEADGEFEWTIWYECPQEEGTFELPAARIVYRHEAVEASQDIDLISHDPPLMQVNVRHRSTLDPSS